MAVDEEGLLDKPDATRRGAGLTRFPYDYDDMKVRYDVPIGRQSEVAQETELDLAIKNWKEPLYGVRISSIKALTRSAAMQMEATTWRSISCLGTGTNRCR